MSAFSSSLPALSHDDIAARAREIWFARSCPIGQDEEIWLEAERQLLSERHASTTPGVSSQRGATGVDIDERELRDSLDDFGDTGNRSPTSIDPTR